MPPIRGYTVQGASSPMHVLARGPSAHSNVHAEMIEGEEQGMSVNTYIASKLNAYDCANNGVQLGVRKIGTNRPRLISDYYDDI